jgi:hypothetical protein
MTGLDFFTAIYRQGLDLPIRITFGDAVDNFYRSWALSFCNLTIEEDEEIPDDMSLLYGYDVSIVVDSLDDRARLLTKAAIAGRPRHLVVASGNQLMSWAPHRGWK